MTSPLARVGLPTSDEAEATPRSSRRALLGIAALSAVGLAVATQLLLGGGSELDDLGTSPAAAAAPPASAAPTPTPTPSVRSREAERVHEGRDPFAPLYVAPAPPAASTGSTGAAPAAAPAAALPASEGTAPGGLPGTSTSAPPAGPASPPAAAASALALLRVEGTPTARSAVFTVDGTEQTVPLGGSFGPSGALLLLSLKEGSGAGGWTAVVQQGSGEPFDVVLGAVVTLS